MQLFTSNFQVQLQSNIFRFGFYVIFKICKRNLKTFSGPSFCQADNFGPVRTSSANSKDILKTFYLEHYEMPVMLCETVSSAKKELPLHVLFVKVNTASRCRSFRFM